MADRGQAAGDHRHSRGAVLGVALLAWLFVVSVWATPSLERRWAGWGVAARGGCVLLCHQKPQRTLLWQGARQAVCARCAGLYLGGGLGLLAALVVGLPAARGRRWLIVGAVVVPTVVDAIAVTLGLSGLDNLPRMLVAIPAGGIAGLLLAEGVADLAHSDVTKERVLETF